jgi:hypothetical protein
VHVEEHGTAADEWLKVLVEARRHKLVEGAK